MKLVVSIISILLFSILSFAQDDNAATRPSHFANQGGPEAMLLPRNTFHDNSQTGQNQQQISQEQRRAEWEQKRQQTREALRQYLADKRANRRLAIETRRQRRQEWARRGIASQEERQASLADFKVDQTEWVEQIHEDAEYMREFAKEELRRQHEENSNDENIQRGNQ